MARWRYIAANVAAVMVSIGSPMKSGALVLAAESQGVDVGGAKVRRRAMRNGTVESHAQRHDIYGDILALKSAEEASVVVPAMSHCPKWHEK